MSNYNPLRIWMLGVDHLVEIRGHAHQECINQGSSLPAAQAPPNLSLWGRTSPQAVSCADSSPRPHHPRRASLSLSNCSRQWQADLTPRRHRFRRQGTSKPNLGNPVTRFSKCKYRLSGKPGVSERQTNHFWVSVSGIARTCPKKHFCGLSEFT